MRLIPPQGRRLIAGLRRGAYPSRAEGGRLAAVCGFASDGSICCSDYTLEG